MTMTTEVSAMNKAKIIAELENMVAARLFSGQPWLADWETYSAINRKLIQMGLIEQVCPRTSRITPLGKELEVDLFQLFMGAIHEWDVLCTLWHYGLLDDSEFDAILEHMSNADDAESALRECVKRVYFDYRRAKCPKLTP
jgi:hypothetical protein